MKRKSICIWNLAGFFFTTAAGIFLHFLPDWYSNPIIHVLAPVNESTWEHLKLLFSPMLLFGILEFFCYGRHYPGFLPIRVCSILIGMVTIIVLFYSYTGVLGFDIPAADIAVFLLGCTAAYCFSCRQFAKTLPDNGEFSFVGKTPGGCFAHPAGIVLSLLLLATLIACFICFSFQPPAIGLFDDPL